MKIVIYKKSTNQRITLSVDNSKTGLEEITAALKLPPYPNSIGLVSPEFTVSIIKGSKRTNFEVFDRGYVLLNKENNKYYFFKHGNIWHDELQKKLTNLLEKNPKYFLNIDKSPKHIKPLDRDMIVRGARNISKAVKKKKTRRVIALMPNTLTGFMQTSAVAKVMKKASAKKSTRSKKSNSKSLKRVLVKKAAKKKK